MRNARLKTLMAVAALSLTSTMATAHDKPALWTGFYIGANAGYGWTHTGDQDFDVSGFAGGLHAGYNFQMGAIVVGVEADYMFTDMGKSHTWGAMTASHSIDSVWSARGRLGFTAGDKLMIYGTAGWAGLEASARASLGGFTASAKAEATGWVWGGGAEYAFTRNVLGRAEVIAGEEIAFVRGGLSYKFSH